MERMEQIRHYAKEILRVARNGLLMNYRFFDRVIYQLTPLENDEFFFGSDGQTLYYESAGLIRSFRENPLAVEWMILHTLFHCLYLHPFLSAGKDPLVWDVACDCYVSHILLLFKKGDSSLSQFIPLDAQNWIENLTRQVHVFSATSLYAYFIRALSQGTLTREALMAASLPLCLDDHRPWYPPEEKEKQPSDSGQGNGKPREDPSSQEKKKPQPADQKPEGTPQKEEAAPQGGEPEEGGEGNGEAPDGDGSGQGGNGGEVSQDSAMAFAQHRQRMERAQEAWTELARQVEVALNANLVQLHGLDPGSFASTLEHITRENESYTDFLRRFASIQEEVRLDMDEFDYIYYTLGMDTYGNVPLVEPLEYKEIPSIRSFVIVLDTSGSCSDELIRRFLTKTYDILCEEQLFGTTLHVHILQCDAAVQSHVFIQNREELEKYAQSVTVLGRGGTDFRPAFAYVDKLFEEEQITKLDGLLYFTDGYGTYPTAPTAYPTAFLFSEMNGSVPVPAWAMRIYIEGMQDLE